MTASDGLSWVTLADLFKAYRKAKVEAYYDRGHFHSIAFASYEQNLENNLRGLLKTLKSGKSWASSSKFIGSYSYMPKSIDVPTKDGGQDIHFATLDPVEDWNRSNSGKSRIVANFRPVIIATVSYQVICALWIMRVGYKYDDAIDRGFAYAHALKRVGAMGRLNDDAHQLFVPYFSGYRAWRSRALARMREALGAGTSIVAVTMDVKSFYHQVSPEFLTRRSFLERLSIDLEAEDLAFTKMLVESMRTWHKSSPEGANRPEGSLPVGLSASRLVSNVLLAEFDRIIGTDERTIHYGRYADDIILVMRAPSVRSGEEFMVWLRKSFDGIFVMAKDEPGPSLRLKLSYASDSDIVFSSRKQKIFFLSGVHGLDLVTQIEEQIKKRSSEYRLLPELPERESEMLDSALLATPDARLEADALRKAEAVSLRRLGFSMLLGDFESYARDLDCGDAAWLSVRRQFYGIVERYLVTPTGFFDYFSYITRIFGLMIACGDYKEAGSLVRQMERVSTLLQKTTTAGKSSSFKFMHARRSYYRGFLQGSLEASSVAGFKMTRNFFLLVKELAANANERDICEPKKIRLLSSWLLKADLGRRSYQDYWYSDTPVEAVQPPVPSSVSVRKTLARVREFRNMAKKTLPVPYWPAVAFPTRPPSLWQLSLSVPSALEYPGTMERLLWAVRGGYVKRSYRKWSFLNIDKNRNHLWRVPVDSDLRPTIAVPSVEVTDEQWGSAVSGAPDHSLARYLGVRRVINEMMRGDDKLRYVVFPELALPYGWAIDIASRLAKAGISFIAGVETRGAGDEYRNDVLVSLATDYYGRRGNICFVQPKISLSHEESKQVLANGKKYAVGGDVDARRPVYMHGEFSFGVLICSDLTNIQNRARYQGEVDALFVVEWNKDVGTFEFLVESAAHDLHAAVVQVNNRRFGDSRVRMPYVEAYKRDVVKVKGGERDFFVFCRIDAAALRKFQSGASLGDKSSACEEGDDESEKIGARSRDFKPTPIGYQIANHRKLFGESTD